MAGKIRSGTLALALVLTAACGSSTAQTSQSGTAAPRRSSASVISDQDIAESTARTGLELVQTLRPHWLRGRGPNTLQGGSSNEVIVYLDNQRFGPISYLDQIALMTIKEMRYLNGSEATNRFGTGHSGGAILVTTGSR